MSDWWGWCCYYDLLGVVCEAVCESYDVVSPGVGCVLADE